MKMWVLKNKSSKFVVFILVILLAISQEGEARRKILRGRKAITRTYYGESAVPSWAIVLLVGLGELIIGVALFMVMKILILDPTIKPRYVAAPISDLPSTP